MDKEDDNNDPAFSGTFKYLIVNPQNGGITDLARFLINNDIHSAAKFLDASDDAVLQEEFLGGAQGDGDDDDDTTDGEAPYHRWVIFVSILVRKIIAVVGKPLEWAGYLVEFILNLLSHNGSFLGLLFNILRGKPLNFIFLHSSNTYAMQLFFFA